ncbi:MAG: hypothetical protein H6797_02650 [Candidatus Nomurabacteria bacterium]|nr:MAG: hypothetical protein H6797_02650 [Candidatus Nomurabacteria bacterium]
MPSLKGVVRNINTTRPHSMALMAGCTLVVAAVLVVTSVVQAYDNQAAYGGYYGLNDGSSLDNGYGSGGNAPYSDGGYGGYPVGSGYLAGIGAGSSTTPYDSGGYPVGTAGNNGYTPVDTGSYPAGADGSNDGNVPIDNGNAQDNGAPVDNGGVPDNSIPVDNETNNTTASPSPEASPSPQPVATANATAKIIINKVAPSSVARATSTSVPTELPVTGLSGGTIASGIGLAGVTAAMAYYLNSRRELHRVISRR